MKILEKIKISSQSDIIYAKTALKNHLRPFPYDFSQWQLALLELATNLIKHANGGAIYFLEHNSSFLLAAADYGPGISDIEWAIKKNTTTKTNSLGLGLYQLTNSDNFSTEIFSATQEELHGTVVLLRPKNLWDNLVYFSIPFYDESHNGDFFIKKGRFFLFGDAAGHNKKSHKAATFTQKFFLNSLFSCILADEFFQNLHNALKKEHLHSVVCVAGELTKNIVQLCGVDLCLWYLEDGRYKLYTFKKGILGESFSRSEYKKIELPPNETIFLTTDGIDNETIFKLGDSLRDFSPFMSAFLIAHFSKELHDDKSILAISAKGAEDGKRV